jgi:hypothetical protein
VASIIIIALGAIAALNQVGIAAAVTQPILYTVLLTAGAVVAIGVGGGLIKPMQGRWERMLSAAERETNAQVTSYQQGRSDAMRAPQHARQPAPTGGQGAAGYSQGPQGAGPGYPEGPGSGYQQGPEGSGGPHGSDPGDWRDPGTSYR